MTDYKFKSTERLWGIDISDSNLRDIFFYEPSYTSTDYDYSLTTYSGSWCFVNFYKSGDSVIYPYGEYNSRTITTISGNFYTSTTYVEGTGDVPCLISAYSFMDMSFDLSNLNGDLSIQICSLLENTITGYILISVDNSLIHIDYNNETYELLNSVPDTIHIYYNGSKLIINNDFFVDVTLNTPFDLRFIVVPTADLVISTANYIPVYFENDGFIGDDIFGDCCVLTDAQYLKSKHNLLFNNNSGFKYLSIFRGVGDNDVFNVSDGINTPLSLNINDSYYTLTTSGVLTASGIVDNTYDYYVLGIDYTQSNVSIKLNNETLFVNNNVCLDDCYFSLNSNVGSLVIDSFKFADDVEDVGLTYAKLLNKISARSLLSTISGTLFGAEFFYPKDATQTAWSNYEGIYKPYSLNDYYTGLSLLGGEIQLDSDNVTIYTDTITNSGFDCTGCREWEFRPVVSDLVTSNQTVCADSFTNYSNRTVNFNTTNSGLYIKSEVYTSDEFYTSNIKVTFSGVYLEPTTNIGITLNGYAYTSLNTFYNIRVFNDKVYVGGVYAGLSTSISDIVTVTVSGTAAEINTGNDIIIGIVDDISSVSHFIDATSSSIYSKVSYVFYDIPSYTIESLTNKCVNYKVSEHFNFATSSGTDMFYKPYFNVDGLLIYDKSFYQQEHSFTEYKELNIQNIVKVEGYNYIGVNEDFLDYSKYLNRWRSVSKPYALYHDTDSPGYIAINSVSCSSCYKDNVHDGNLYYPAEDTNTYNSNINLYISESIVSECVLHIVSEDPNIAADLEFSLTFNRQGYQTTYYVNQVYTVSGSNYYSVSIPTPIIRCDRIYFNKISGWPDPETDPYIVISEIGIYNNDYTKGSVEIFNIGNNVGIYTCLWDTVSITADYNITDSFISTYSGSVNYPQNYMCEVMSNLKYSSIGYIKWIDSTTIAVYAASGSIIAGDTFSSSSINGSVLNHCYYHQDGYWVIGADSWTTSAVYYRNTSGGSFVVNLRWYIAGTSTDMVNHIFVGCSSIPTDETSSVGGYDFFLNSNSQQIGVSFNGTILSQVSISSVPEYMWFNYKAEVIEGDISIYVDGDRALHYIDVIRSLTGDYNGVACRDNNSSRYSRVNDFNVSSFTTVSGNLCSVIGGCCFDVNTYFEASTYMLNIDINCSGIVTSNIGYHYGSFSNIRESYFNEVSKYTIASGTFGSFTASGTGIEFTSIRYGLQFDEPGNVDAAQAGISYKTYPPNLFVRNTDNSFSSYSIEPVLVSSLNEWSASKVGGCVYTTLSGSVGGLLWNTNDISNIKWFSEYDMVPSVFYKVYEIGNNRKYASFNDVSNLVRDGDKVYFYEGSYSVSTDKDLYLISVIDPSNVSISLNLSGSCNCYNATIKGISGSGSLSAYNCYVMSIRYDSDPTHFIIVNDTTVVYYHNCNLYNYNSYSKYGTDVYLYNCLVYSSSFETANWGNVNIRVGDYKINGTYGYGVNFNKSNFLSGLVSLDSITLIDSTVVTNSTYFPVSDVEHTTDTKPCFDLFIPSTFTYFLYGDMKNVSTFYVYVLLVDSISNYTLGSDFININITNSHISVNVTLLSAVINIEEDFEREVLKPGMVCVSYNDNTLSLILNGSKIACKYIYISQFTTEEECLFNPLFYFDRSGLAFDGSGIKFKGNNIFKYLYIMSGMHNPDKPSSDYDITINISWDNATCRDNYYGSIGKYGYRFEICGGIEYNGGYVFFNGHTELLSHNNVMTSAIYNIYRYDSATHKYYKTDDYNYITPVFESSVHSTTGKLNNEYLYDANAHPYYNNSAFAYSRMCFYIPTKAKQLSSFFFDRTDSKAKMLVYIDSNLNAVDVVNNLSVNRYNPYASKWNYKDGCFHKSIQLGGGSYYYINTTDILKLSNTFTLESLAVYHSTNAHTCYFISKGIDQYNYAYSLGITDKGVLFFKWSWDGDNVIYANKPLPDSILCYVSVVINPPDITFYINGYESGSYSVSSFDKANNDETLFLGYGTYRNGSTYSYIGFEELYILDRAKTSNEVYNTWLGWSSGDEDLSISIDSVVFVSDSPLKATIYDRMLPNGTSNSVDLDKWSYVSYAEINYTTDGVIIDSRSTDRMYSKQISFSMCSDVRITYKIIDFSQHRSWEIKFKYVFISGNYIEYIIEYDKEDIYIKYKYLYNGFVYTSSKIYFSVAEYSIRFVTSFDGYTSLYYGTGNAWSVLWTSEQYLFVETSGRLQIFVEPTDWDAWVVFSVKNFYVNNFFNNVEGDIVYAEGSPLLRDYFGLDVCPHNNIVILPNRTINVSSTNSYYTHMVFNNVLDTPVSEYNNTVSNVAYNEITLELCVFVTDTITDIFNMYPHFMLRYDVSINACSVIINGIETGYSLDKITLTSNSYQYIAIELGGNKLCVRIQDALLEYTVDMPLYVINNILMLGRSFSGRSPFMVIYKGPLDVVGYNSRKLLLSNLFIGFDVRGERLYGNNYITSGSNINSVPVLNYPVNYVLSYSGSDTNIGLDIDKAIVQDTLITRLFIEVTFSSVADIHYYIKDNKFNYRYLHSFSGSLGSDVVYDDDLKGYIKSKVGYYVLDVDYPLLCGLYSGHYTINLDTLGNISNVKIYVLSAPYSTHTIQNEFVCNKNKYGLVNPLDNYLSFFDTTDFLTVFYKLYNVYSIGRHYIEDLPQYYVRLYHLDGDVNVDGCDFYSSSTFSVNRFYSIPLIDIEYGLLTLYPEDYYSVLSIRAVVDGVGILMFIGYDVWDINYRNTGNNIHVVSGEGVYIVYGKSSISCNEPHISINSYLLLVKTTYDFTVINTVGTDVNIKKINSNEFLVFNTSSGLVSATSNTLITGNILPSNVDVSIDISVENYAVSVHCNGIKICDINDNSFIFDYNTPIHFNIESIHIRSVLNLGQCFLCDNISEYSNTSSRFITGLTGSTYSDNIMLLSDYNDVFVLDIYNDSVNYMHGGKYYSHNSINDVIENMFVPSTYRNITGLTDVGTIKSIAYSGGLLLILYQNAIVVFDINGYLVKSIPTTNISFFKYIGDYVYLYNKSRMKLYRIFTNNFIDFFIPQIIMHIDFSRYYKICMYGNVEIKNLNGQYYSLVVEDSLQSYFPTYSYTEYRTYMVGSNKHYNLIYKYDRTEHTLLFNGILTYLGYMVKGTNVWQNGVPSFTIFLRFKPLSLEFKRYLFRAAFAVEVYFVDSLLYVDVICDNDTLSVVSSFVFEVGEEYNVHVVFSRYKGLFIYVNGMLTGSYNTQHDTGNVKSEVNNFSIGAYTVNKYSPYKFYGYLYEFYIVGSYTPYDSIKLVYLNNITDIIAFIDSTVVYSTDSVMGIVEHNNTINVIGYNTVSTIDVNSFEVLNTYKLSGFVVDYNVNDSDITITSLNRYPSIKLTCNNKGAVKLDGDYTKYLFVSNNGRLCCSYFTNNSTYIQSKGGSISLIDMSDYYVDYSNIGSVSMGNYKLDSFSTEYKVIGEFYFDGDVIRGTDADSYTNGGPTIMSDCNGSLNASIVYNDYFASYVLVDGVDYDNDIDMFFGLYFAYDGYTAINFMNLCLAHNYKSFDPLTQKLLYNLLINRYDFLRFPQEILMSFVATSVGGAVTPPIDPISLYITDADMLGDYEVSYYIHKSEHAYIYRKGSSTKFSGSAFTDNELSYDFSGGHGTGIVYKTDDLIGKYGEFLGNGYIVNKAFNKDPVWDISVSAVIYTNSSIQFNPIISKTDGVVVSFQLALRYNKVVFMYTDSEGILSEIDLGVTVSENTWNFLGILITDASLHVVTDNSSTKIDIYNKLVPFDTYLYVGYGVELGLKSKYFYGNLSQIKVMHNSNLNDVIHHRSIYTSDGSSVLEPVSDIVGDNLDCSDNIFKIGSSHTYDMSEPRRFYFTGLDALPYNVEASFKLTDATEDTRNVLTYNLDTYEVNYIPITNDVKFLSKAPNNDIYTYTGEWLEVSTDTDMFSFITSVFISNNTLIYSSIGGISITTDSVKNLFVDSGVSKALVFNDNLFYISGDGLYSIPLVYLLNYTNGDTIYKFETLIDNVIDINVHSNYLLVLLQNGHIITYKDTYITTDIDVDLTNILCFSVDVIYAFNDNTVVMYNRDVDSFIKTTIIDKSVINDVTVYADGIVITTFDCFYIYSNSYLKTNIIGETGILSDAAPLIGKLYSVTLLNDKVYITYYSSNAVKFIEYNLDNLNNVITHLNIPVYRTFSTDNVPKTITVTAIE